MPVSHKLVARIVSDAGGTIYGRLKVQKILYLLDQLGLDSDANYFYHHYGPYSEDISDAIMDAKFFGLLKEETEHRVGDGVPYSVFQSVEEAVQELVSDHEIPVEDIISLNSTSSIILELAATIHWLAQVEKVDDWRKELVSRKQSKASPGRIECALTILKDLKLEP